MHIMAIIKWRDTYSVGVEKFDNEHKILLGLINEMYVIVRDHQSLDNLIVAINTLIQYTQVHFSDEEQAMEGVDYPKLQEHIIIHEKLLNEVTHYKKRVENNEDEAIQDFYLFLRDWLLTHILEEDMLYKPFLRANS